MRPRLVDVVGPDPVLHSWGYADAVLRGGFYPQAKNPQTPFYPRGRLWVPLECAIAIVQAVYKAHDSVGGENLSTASITTTTGNSVVVFTRSGPAAGGTPTVTSVSDGTNTFTQRAHYEGADPFATVWTAANITGVSHTIDVAWAAGTAYNWCYALELSGVATSPFDIASTNHQSAATALLSSSLTTAQAVEIVLMSANQDNFATYTAHADSASNTWLLQVGNINAGTGNYGGIEYFITSSAFAGVTAQMTSDTSANYTTCWVAMKAPASATRGLFRTPPLSGVGVGGSFFRSPLQERMH